ncbi:MAG: efflux RND transporter permease subunit [Haliscomenobacter sp.]|nr:efflux RND transporter permease subunit [Haliscomenobacter sp.]
MIRYLLQRPIAVLMSFGAVLLFGLAALRQLPISLLPPIDVPRILVRVSYPNTPAAALEQNVVAPIRENLLTTNGLRNITSKTANHAAVIQLEFEYNTRMDLAFIEVNEKLDRLGGLLPRKCPAPGAAH